LLFLLFSLLPHVTSEGENQTQPFSFNATKVPLVFVYLLDQKNSAHCRRTGLPEYAIKSMKHATETQPDAQVILISNPSSECPAMARSIKHLRHHTKLKAHIIEAKDIQSQRTTNFEENYATPWFLVAGLWEFLYKAALLRFFLLEDLMRAYGMTHLMHMETDILLYAPLGQLAKALLKTYPGLGANPLGAYGRVVTASTFWVGSADSLTHLNNWFIKLMDYKSDLSETQSVIRWARKEGSEVGSTRRVGGLYPSRFDMNEDYNSGSGVKMHFFNEMTLLAYYAGHAGKGRMLFFPPLPPPGTKKPYYLPNVRGTGRNYSIGGGSVGPPIANLVFDSGSWGQYIGGAYRARGKFVGSVFVDKNLRQFTDSAHIVGRLIMTHGNMCTLKMLCSGAQRFERGGDSASSKKETPRETNLAASFYLQQDMPSTGNWDLDMAPSLYRHAEDMDNCYRQPYVACVAGKGKEATAGPKVRWYPLANLHVHSKQVNRFLSTPCSCEAPK
jgi:hypothetical protein